MDFGFWEDLQGAKSDGMLDQTLSLEFLWFPEPEELPELEELLAERSNAPTFKPSGPLLKLKTNVSNFCGFPIFVKDCKKRNEVPDNSQKESALTAESSLYHLEFLYNVLCTIKLERNPEEDFRKFVNLFCSTIQGRLRSDVYLKFDSSVFPWTGDIDTKLTPIEVERFSLGNLVGMGTFVERFNSKNALEKEDHKITQVRLQMLHDYKKLVVYFVVGKIIPVKKRDATTHLHHKLEVHYSSLHSIIVSKSKKLIVYFKMLSPPLLYSVEQEQDSEIDYISFSEISPRTEWFRAIDLVKGGPTKLRKEFSMNTVLRLEFKSSDQDYDFLFQLLPHCSGVQMFFSPVSLRVPEEKVPSIVPKFDAKKDDRKEEEQFECHYALQCILTRSYEVIDQVTGKAEAEEVKTLLQKGFNTSSHALKEALYFILEALTKGVPLDFKHCLKFVLHRLKDQEPSSAAKDLNSETSHLVMTKRAILTPTHLVLLPPRLTLKSRALRDCDPGYSLRVIIRDVHHETITQSVRAFGPKKMEKQRDFFDTYFKFQLLKGFKIEKREYRYVGSSTSQLKGHGLWFYAEDRNRKTAEKLRASFGQLEKIKEVPRYMARMGQTFSQSMGNVPVPQEWTNVNDPEPDVTGGVKKYLVVPDAKERKKKHLKTIEDSDEEGQEEGEDEDQEPYTFSDGVGRISPELAEEVYKSLGVEEERPSAMQIRYAGCKGMLVVDPNLEGKKILFRKSMVKFSSNHNSLEILKFSEKRSVFLNRPLITILEGLGIGRGVFLRLQKEMIQSHILAMFHESHACSFLHRHSLLRFNFLSMYAAKIKFTEDPLFRSMIFSLFQKQIELLKNKANIEIPVNLGRNMFGVMDDTFTLEYGQVFVQYTDWETDEPIILTGTIVVTKNPCMHPGDVRKFEAVDVEGLHHIRDCIVFPAKGHRPHPDEMAGSDLDGDEYHVMWCKELIFPSENVEPMHFAQKKKKGDDQVKCPVQVSDELDHFCEFIFHDNVGVIANAHLAWADQMREGVHSKVCLRLAALYSMALDFAKTGKGVSIGPDSAQKAPDFMQKLNHKKTYLSKKSLGVLFRNCKRLELGVDSESNNKDFKLDHDLVHEEWQKYERPARRFLNWYRHRIEFFLRSFGFENEGQLLAGTLLTPASCIENRHDLQNIIALLEFQVPWIFKDLNKRFYTEFGGKPNDGVFTDAMLQKASAWYMVTYGSTAENGSKYPVFGFPWAVHEVLVALKNRQHSASSLVRPTDGRTLLESLIDQSVASRLPKLGPDADIAAVHAGRLQVLDVAMKILERWVKTQREYFSEEGVKELLKVISDEFQNLTMDITTCSEPYIKALRSRGELKRATSPSHLVIQTLLHVSQLSTDGETIRCQELGLLAWTTLLKLASSYNPQHLGIPDPQGRWADPVIYRARDDIIDTIQLPLFDRSDETNVSFSQLLTHDSRRVWEYLKRETKLDEITFRIVPGFNNQDYARFTVKGTRYSIERIKDIVVMDDFFDAVVSGKPSL